MTSWTGARIVDESPSGYVELTENGFGAMVGWFAGPENTVRIHDSPGLHQDIIDGEIDAYLSDCRIPVGRPRGFRWFVRLPDGVRAEQFWPMINTHLRANDVGPHPAETAQAVRELLATRY